MNQFSIKLSLLIFWQLLALPSFTTEVIAANGFPFKTILNNIIFAKENLKIFPDLNFVEFYQKMDVLLNYFFYLYSAVKCII